MSFGVFHGDVLSLEHVIVSHSVLCFERSSLSVINITTTCRIKVYRYFARYAFWLDNNWRRSLLDWNVAFFKWNWTNMRTVCWTFVWPLATNCLLLRTYCIKFILEVHGDKHKHTHMFRSIIILHRDFFPSISCKLQIEFSGPAHSWSLSVYL